MKFITEVGFTRAVVMIFEKRVNAAMQDGFIACPRCCQVVVQKCGLRYICQAVLSCACTHEQCANHEE